MWLELTAMALGGNAEKAFEDFAEKNIISDNHSPINFNRSFIMVEMSRVAPTGLVWLVADYFFPGKVILRQRIDIHPIIEGKSHLIDKLTQTSIVIQAVLWLLDCTSVLVLKLTPATHLAAVKSSTSHCWSNLENEEKKKNTIYHECVSSSWSDESPVYA